ncbi:hypothetical protein DRP53_07940 [candidate division WOR-3 bacterium]|uniref:Outer membrane protein assembly factor BamE domain-containing protein n=1 Tax=candidate division WOR-3 bacterium TaxID=2052148 RepID=A0A660SHR1_UNCW3|nr:MAG: hypothetical protein DRP53_07940 [candidate division WOR-3 bacterium]
MFIFGILTFLLFDQNINRYIDLLIEDPTNSAAIERITAAGVEAIPVIKQRIPELGVPVKRTLARILGTIGDTSAAPILLNLTRSDAPLLRAEAAHALGRIKDPRASPRLIELLSDIHDNPRGEAAWALGEIGDTTAIPALVSLTNDPVFTNRARALTALGKLNGLDQIIDLDRFLTDPNPPVRISLALAIGVTKDTSYLSILERLARDKEPVVRIQAYKVIGSLQSGPSKSLLVAGLSDPHEGVRMQIIESLIAFADPKLIPYIVQMKNDPSLAVRKRVNELLKSLPPELFKQGMIEVIAAADLPLDLRRGALVYLERNLDEEELITHLLNAFPSWTREEAVNVIRREIEPGMTKEQVRLAFGSPSTTKKDTTGIEIWYYEKSGLKLKFSGGRVVR